MRIGISKRIKSLNLSVTSMNGFGTKGREQRRGGLILHDGAGSCGVRWVESSGFTNATIADKTASSPFELKVHGKMSLKLILIWTFLFLGS